MKRNIVMIFSLMFGISCLCFCIFWMMMAKDLVEKVTILERGLNNCELYTQQFE